MRLSSAKRSATAGNIAGVGFGAGSTSCSNGFRAAGSRLVRASSPDFARDRDLNALIPPPAMLRVKASVRGQGWVNGAVGNYITNCQREKNGYFLILR